MRDYCVGANDSSKIRPFNSDGISMLTEETINILNYGETSDSFSVVVGISNVASGAISPKSMAVESSTDI